MESDHPKSVRIPTDEDHSWRYRAIERARAQYGVSKADTVGLACQDIDQLVDGIEDVLQREDLSLRQRKEIAETLSTSAIVWDIETDIEMRTD